MIAEGRISRDNEKSEAYKALVDLMQEMKNDGHSNEEIAVAFRTTESAVRTLLTTHI
jgi:hypothetical protein